MAAINRFLKIEIYIYLNFTDQNILILTKYVIKAYQTVTSKGKFVAWKKDWYIFTHIGQRVRLLKIAHRLNCEII